MENNISTAWIVDGTDCSDLLEKHYGKIPVKIEKMPGFFDQTFLIKDKNDNAKYIFKIVRAHLAKAEAEVAIMKHLEINGLPVPVVIPTKSGEWLGEADFTTDDRGKHSKIIRLQTFIDGALLQPRINEELSFQYGDLTGRVDVALRSFQHPFYEDTDGLLNFIGLNMRELIPKIPDKKKRQMSETFVKLYEQKVLSKSDQLPRQQIHGDLHSLNVIADEQFSSIVGLIDFDICVNTFRIIEVGTIVADILLCDILQPDLDVIACVRAFLRGYEKQIPMSKAEKEALAVVSAGRLVVLKALHNHMAMINPNFVNPYEAVYGSPWHVIEDLLEETGKIGAFFKEYASS